MNEHYRQGDVFLIKVDALPVGAKVETVGDSVVLAYGETTGHSHRLNTHIDGLTMYAWKEDKLVELRQPGELRHEEHDPIALAPGFYKVVIQREYTPERIRRVVD
jgi:hypothetical protein